MSENNYIITLPKENNCQAKILIHKVALKSGNKDIFIYLKNEKI